MTVPGDIQAPLSLLFQRRSIKLFKRLMVGYMLPGTPLDIRQKARVLWQSLSLLSQCSEHVTIPHNFRICVRALCACTCVVSRVNSTDIRMSCSPHPLIVDCLLAPPTLLLSMQNVLEQGPDFWCWFDKLSFRAIVFTQYMHAKMFSIQIIHFSQIVPRVCSLVLFIDNSTDHYAVVNMITVL